MTHEEAGRELRQLASLFRSVEGKAWISAERARHLADCIDLLLQDKQSPDLRVDDPVVVAAGSEGRQL